MSCVSEVDHVLALLTHGRISDVSMWSRDLCEVDVMHTVQLTYVFF